MNLPHVKIAHITTVHHRDDTRIYLKECKSLEAIGYEISLIVADGFKECTIGNIRIIDVGRYSNLFDRFFYRPICALKEALRGNYDLYHLHDPELIFIGLVLKCYGKKVIFDAHEDFSSQVLGRKYLNPILRRMVSKIIRMYERFSFKRFDGLITATPHIGSIFHNLGIGNLVLNNYPLLHELDPKVDWGFKSPEVCYVGGISSVRGVIEIIQSLLFLKSDARLNLCGEFSNQQLEFDCKVQSGWHKVNEYGFLDRAGVREILGRSVAGIVTFMPLPNHIHAQPNKMFEYMSAGIPVIASDFPLWREIVAGNNCGICVDPMNTESIASAIDFLVMNPGVAQQMGENGRQAVINKYNWSVEESKLINFYDNLLIK